MARKMIGLPTPAPRCVNCGKPFKPNGLNEWDHNPDGSLVVGSRHLVFYGWREYGGGLFHSLRCALSFAVGAYAAGYRVHRPKSHT